jgi:microcystin-dependent protein
MKKQLALFFFITAFFMTNTLTFAQGIPKQISYQGKLLENGLPVTGTKNFTFSFIDTDWSEDHENVDVTKGLYFVNLGSINPIPISIIEKNANITLRIAVNGVVLEPDVTFNSTISTRRAEVADRLKGNSVFVDTNDNVGIGKNDPQEKLDIDGGIRLGSTNTVNPGTIRWTGSDFEGYNGKEWVSLTQKRDPINGDVLEAVAGENLNGGITPVPIYISKDGLILEQTSGEQKAVVYNINKYAQTFITDIGTNEIKKVALLLEKTGSPTGNVEVSIHALYENTTPTTFSLGTPASKSAESISDGWNEFAFESPIQVVPSTSYAVVVSLPKGENNNNIKWFYSGTNVYPGGNYLESSDYGTNWTGLTDKDFVFKLFSDHRVYACNAADYKKVDFAGFAITTAKKGEKVTVQINGVVDGFEDLSIGKKYYIQDIPGTVSNLPGTNVKIIAVAQAESKLQFFSEEEMSGITGEIRMWAGETPPNGWFICDGRIISRIQYVQLYSVIGTNYGEGDGSTTFNIPDLKGKVPVGKKSTDTDFNKLGNQGGEKRHKLTADESGVPEHYHPIKVRKRVGNNYSSSDVWGNSGGGEYTSFNGVEVRTNTPQNASTAHNNLQPYIVLNYIIKY